MLIEENEEGILDRAQIERLLKIERALDLHSIIGIADQEGKITYVNEKFCEISKYPEKELLNQNHRMLKSGFHPPEFFVGMWNTISSGKTWRGEIKNKAKDGSFYWVKTIIVPILDKQGNVQEFVSIRTDITKEKKMQDELIKNHEVLIKNERLATIGEISSRISHDLKNPLNVIGGYMELVEFEFEGKKSEEMQKNFTIIKQAISEIDSLANDILDFVRHSEIRRHNTKLSNVLKTSIELMEVPSSVKIIFPENDEEISCDSKKMTVVFCNLFTNSIQAMDNSGEITLRTYVDEKNLIIELEDSGPGISDSDLPKVFDALFTTKPKGTGLGLASCKNIIERHGGTISVKNNPTIFTIKFPKK